MYCTCRLHVPKDERDKLDAKSKRCIFLGYGFTTTEYHLYNLNARKVLHSHDVIFDEMQRVSFEKESSQNESSEQKVEFEIPVEQAGESEDSDAAPDVAGVEL